KHVFSRLALAGFAALLLGGCGDATPTQATTVAAGDAALLQRLAVVQHEVELAEDLAAIKRLQKAYGYYLDKGLWTDLAELFADDARASYPAGVYIGKASIREHLYRNVGGVAMGEVGLGDGRLY